jgi:hypothetical protein
VASPEEAERWRRAFGVLGFVSLLLVAVPVGLAYLSVLLSSGLAAVAFAGGVAAAVVLNALRVLDRVLVIGGAVAAVAGLVSVIEASALDVEGRLDDGPYTTFEGVVVYTALIGGSVAAAFGLLAAVLARGWLRRNVGLAIAVAGMFTVAGLAFI